MLLYGPPGTGKTLCARAVANRTDSTFIRVIGSELVQKYIGEGARMVRELFEMARSKKACIIFFDEVDAIGGARVDDGAGGDNEVQRTMLELINQLDGFDARGNIKVIMATNRPDTLDPALLRPGRLDRKVEFSLPDVEGRAHILRIHGKSMSVERDIRYDLIARLCPNATGAELKSVATEAGMFAIRARRKVATERDFLDAVEKVIRQGTKFSSTALYAQYASIMMEQDKWSNRADDLCRTNCTTTSGTEKIKIKMEMEIEDKATRLGSGSMVTLGGRLVRRVPAARRERLVYCIALDGYHEPHRTRKRANKEPRGSLTPFSAAAIRAPTRSHH